MKLVIAFVFAQCAFNAYAAEVAREYPARPVRLINPFPPGGSSDPSCRLLADALTRSLGQQFVVDNRGGGNGNIGTAIAAKSTPDGYVLVFASGTTFTINPFIYKSLGFDPKRDFAPVIRFGAAPNVLVVHPSLACTHARRVHAVRKEPGGRAELRFCGKRQQHAPRGRAVSEDDRNEDGARPVCLSGRRHGGHDREPHAAHIPSGARRRTTGPRRKPACARRARAAPRERVARCADDEGSRIGRTGIGYVVYGARARGTPRPIIDRLNRQINASLAEPAFRKRVEDMGVTPMGGTPEDVTSYIASESARWSDVVKSAGIRMD